MVEKLHLNEAGTSNDPYGSGEDFRALDFGATGGIGFEFGPENRCVTLETRYTRSLTNALGSGFTEKLYNSDFRVLVGWKTTWSSISDIH